MEQDEIISRAVRIVKNNNKYHKSVLSGFFDDSVGARSSPFGGGPSSSSPEKYDLYFVKTDQKDFYVENSENYNIDEIKEIFEKKLYTNVNVAGIEFRNPFSVDTYIDINNIPENTATSTSTTSTAPTSGTSSPSSSSSSSSSSSKMRYYTLGSNKGIFYIKEDSENPYVKDAFERLLTRRFSDLEISSFDVSERPTVDERDYQSLSEFVANPKFKTRPPVNMNAFSDENKTYYYKVETNHGTFLIRDESTDILDANDIKLVLKRNFRDIQINNLRRSLGTVHTGHSDSDYQTFEEFFRSPRDVNSTPIKSGAEIITEQLATMDPPPNAIVSMFNRDIADLPVDVQKEITSHRTKYWMAHSLFRESLRRFRITGSSTVSSLSPDDQEIGEVLINLYDDIENGQVTQKQFIDRMKKVQDINTARARGNADFITEILLNKKRK
jgi:hypothetical protein